MGDTLPWNERVLQDIKRIGEKDMSCEDCLTLVNEVRVSLALGTHSIASASTTMSQLQDIQLCLLMLDWSTPLLCQALGKVLCTIIQASNRLLPYCDKLKGENPVLYSLDAFTWNPVSIFSVCSELVGCLDCFNDYALEYLEGLIVNNLKIKVKFQELSDMLRLCCRLLVSSSDSRWLHALRFAFLKLYNKDVARTISTVLVILKDIYGTPVNILRATDRILVDGLDSEVILVLLSIESISTSTSLLPASQCDDLRSVEATKILVDKYSQQLQSAVTVCLHYVPLIAFLRSLLILREVSHHEDSSSSYRREALCQRMFVSVSQSLMQEQHKDTFVPLVLKAVEEMTSTGTIVNYSLLLNLWAEVCSQGGALLLSNDVGVIRFFKKLLTEANIRRVNSVLIPMIPLLTDLPNLTTIILEKLPALLSFNSQASQIIGALDFIIPLLRYLPEDCCAVIVDSVFEKLSTMSALIRREVYTSLIVLLRDTKHSMSTPTLILLRAKINVIISKFTSFPENLELLTVDVVNDINSVSVLIQEDLEMLLLLSFHLDAALEPELTKIGLANLCRTLLQLPNNSVDTTHIEMFGPDSDRTSVQATKDSLQGLHSLQFIVALIDFVRHGIFEVLNGDEMSHVSSSNGKSKSRTAKQSIEAIRLKSARCVTRLSMIYSSLSGLMSCFISLIESEEQCFLCALPVIQVMMSSIVAVCPTTEEDGTSRTVVISSHRDMTNHYIANLSGMDTLTKEAEESNDRSLSQRCFVNRCSWSIQDLQVLLEFIASMINKKKLKGYEALSSSIPLSMKWTALAHSCHLVGECLESISPSVDSLTDVLKTLDDLHETWFSPSEQGFISAVQASNSIPIVIDATNSRNKKADSSNGFDIKRFVKSAGAYVEASKNLCPLLFDNLEYDNCELLLLWSEKDSLHIQNPDVLPFLKCFLTVIANECPQSIREIECFDIPFSTSVSLAKQKDDARDLFISTRTSVVKALRTVCSALSRSHWQSDKWSQMCKTYASQFVELITEVKLFSESMYISYLELIHELHQGWLSQIESGNAQSMLEVAVLLLHLLKEPQVSTKKSMITALLAVALSLSGLQGVSVSGSLIKNILNPPTSDHSDIAESYWTSTEDSSRSIDFIIHKNNCTLALEYLLTYVLDSLQRLSKSNSGTLEGASQVLSSLLLMFESSNEVAPMALFQVKVQRKVLFALKIYPALCLQDLKCCASEHEESDLIKPPALLILSRAWFECCIHSSVLVERYLLWLCDCQLPDLSARCRELLLLLISLRDVCANVVAMPGQQIEELQTMCQAYLSLCKSTLDQRYSENDDGFEIMRPKKGASRRSRQVENDSSRREADRPIKRRRRQVAKVVPEVRSHNRGINMLASPDDYKYGDYGVDLEDWIVSEDEGDRDEEVQSINSEESSSDSQDKENADSIEESDDDV